MLTFEIYLEFWNHPLTSEILAEFLAKPKFGYFRVSSKQMRYWKLATIWYSGPSPHVSFVEQTNSSGARNGNHVEVLRRQEEELKRVTKHLGKKEPKEKTKFAATSPICQDILLINFGQQHWALVANWKELSPDIKLLIHYVTLGSRYYFSIHDLFLLWQSTVREWQWTVSAIIGMFISLFHHVVLCCWFYLAVHESPIILLLLLGHSCLRPITVGALTHIHHLQIQRALDPSISVFLYPDISLKHIPLQISN